ncbi:MAG: phosphatidate cytidylyltransferase [Bacteroidetes bacterium]|nr:phosphatidate cytidylyltransferase [Bacteroidota bacterium]
MKSNLSQRATTGILFVLVLLSAMWYSFATFAALFAVISLIGLNEFYGLFKNSVIQPNRILGLLIGALAYCSFIAYTLDHNYMAWASLSIPLVVCIFIAELYRKTDQPFTNIALTISGIGYVILPFGFLLVANYEEMATFSTRKFDIAFAFFFMLWANDTGAYFSGTKYGKHKLFERISPKKSWEGFIGGAIAALIIGFVCHSIFQSYTLVFWLLMALTVVIFGTLGDLAESMLKRSLGIKDSGTILPGHGGILDRFDGLLLAAPMVYFLIKVYSALS